MVKGNRCSLGLSTTMDSSGASFKPSTLFTAAVHEMLCATLIFATSFYFTRVGYSKDVAAWFPP